MGDSWLRYIADGEVVWERLGCHPCLKQHVGAGKYFSIQCDSTQVSEWLQKALSFAPWSERLGKPIEVIAYPGRHPNQGEWFGYQSGNVICLYYPAYQNVSTLVFTFFHEYGHLLQEQGLAIVPHVFDTYVTNISPIDLARISHQLSTAAGDMPVISGILGPQRLNIASAMAHLLGPSVVVRTAGYFTRLATKSGEKCGLDHCTFDIHEKFANDFAWFCCNPDFLTITNKEAVDIFVHIFGGGQC